MSWNRNGVMEATVASWFPDFSNRASYAPGDIVAYWGNYWKATRVVEPPILPSIMSGDVPGVSDAWVPASAAEVVARRDTVQGTAAESRAAAAEMTDSVRKPLMVFGALAALVVGYAVYTEFVKR